MSRIDPATSRFLDAARWMAAFAVVVAHVCTLVMKTGGAGAGYSLPVLVMGTLGNIGHLAVVIFFVISGYLVGGQELLRLQDGAPLSIRRFAIQRFSRIYTVLAPALLMTLVFDALGARFANGSGAYTDPPPAWMHPIESREGVGTLIGNLLNLQTIFVEPFGSDGPLWSLANEWWYYVVFGLVLVSLAHNRAPAPRMAALAAAAVLIGVLPAAISLWFSLWLVGVALALLGRRWPGLPYRIAVGLMITGFLVALLGMRLTELFWTQPQAVLNAYSLAVDATAAVAFGIALLSANRADLRGTGQVHRTLAGFSFSLYAVHYPALLFLLALAHDRLGIEFVQPIDWAGFVISAITLVPVVAYAWCFAALTERQTGTVRATLTRLSARRVRAT